MSMQQRTVNPFNQVRFRGPGRLTIFQGIEESLSVEAPEYLMSDIVSEVCKSVLKLGYVSPKIYPLQVQRESICYRLSGLNVLSLVSSGSGVVLIPDLDNDVFFVEIRGSGQVVLENLTADRFDTCIAGSGSLRVTGDVESQTVQVSGSGSYNANGLVSDYADVEVTGSGDVGVSVTDDLNVVIRGSGNVTFDGYPGISRHISGSGRLIRRRRVHVKNKQGGEHVI